MLHFLRLTPDLYVLQTILLGIHIMAGADLGIDVLLVQGKDIDAGDLLQDVLLDQLLVGADLTAGAQLQGVVLVLHHHPALALEERGEQLVFRHLPPRALDLAAALVAAPGQVLERLDLLVEGNVGEVRGAGTLGCGLLHGEGPTLEGVPLWGRLRLLVVAAEGGAGYHLGLPGLLQGPPLPRRLVLAGWGVEPGGVLALTALGGAAIEAAEGGAKHALGVDLVAEEIGQALLLVLLALPPLVGAPAELVTDLPRLVPPPLPWVGGGERLIVEEAPQALEGRGLLLRLLLALPLPLVAAGLLGGARATPELVADVFELVHELVEAPPLEVGGLLGGGGPAALVLRLADGIPTREDRQLPTLQLRALAHLVADGVVHAVLALGGLGPKAGGGGAVAGEVVGRVVVEGRLADVHLELLDVLGKVLPLPLVGAALRA